MKILHVVGARPNFIKIAAVMRGLEKTGEVEQTLVHTGQHYDDALSAQFFEDLDIPRPDLNLGVGSGSHATQTAKILMAIEPVLMRSRPDWLFTVGDVNSTLAASLAAAKLGVGVAHVEAGLRSRDWSMPEEVNRVLTDRLSGALFTTEPEANANLLAEGHPANRINYVGNVMIDTLDRYRPRAARLATHQGLGLESREYVLATLHRPRNVDDPVRLAAIMRALVQVMYECGCPVVLPLHPRTSRNIRAFGLEELLRPLSALAPQSYLDFLCLMDNAGAVLTDSGGIQEETSVLGIPCVTLRPATERPITVTEGTNRLFDGAIDDLVEVVSQALGEERQPCRPALWDGRAADRIAYVMINELAGAPVRATASSAAR